MKDALEEGRVAPVPALLVDLIHAPRRPRVHRRVHVAERPLVSRYLAVGVHVPLAQHENQLALGEVGVDQRDGHAVKSKVPRGEPRILPLVGHRDDVSGVEMSPIRIAPGLARLGRRRPGGIAVEPPIHFVAEVLLRPHQPGKCLAHHQPFVVSDVTRLDHAVKLVGFSFALIENLFVIPERVRVLVCGQAESNRDGLPRGDGEGVVSGGFGADPVRVHALRRAVHNRIVDAVFDKRRSVGRAPQPPGVRLVFGEE